MEDNQSVILIRHNHHIAAIVTKCELIDLAIFFFEVKPNIIKHGRDMGNSGYTAVVRGIVGDGGDISSIVDPNAAIVEVAILRRLELGALLIN